jgi:phosphoenolpyruvate-protein kinase (PTS system EI component)
VTTVSVMSGDVADRIVTAVRAAASAGDQLAVAAALHSVQPVDLARFFHARLEPAATEPLAVGLPASPGAASGRMVLSAPAALAAAEHGDAVILVRRETTPDDVLGMQVSSGLLTCRGGLVSHAAVVARGWGIPAVVGAADVHIDGDTVTIGDTVFHEGDLVTIDGSTGNIYAGRLATSAEDAPPELERLLSWADAVAAGHVEVRVNADTGGDAGVGRRRGARGIGLCRTEHMFLSADRLQIMRRFILVDDAESDAMALASLEEAQTADFEALLMEMDGLPVTVRLLDPPLHEFLPDLLDLTAREARGDLDDSGRVELAAVRRLHEVNPMLGTRGVRLGVMRSGIYEMQVRALCRAAATLFERGHTPRVELMIPLVIDAEELRIARSWVTGVLDEIGHPELASDAVTVGAMIETPRAALTAAALAEHADFFSFGTNDLTQLTYAFSRDDVESRLLPAYQALGILPANPFAVLDQHGVGELVRIACDAARAVKPGIKLGVCGEHAGDPDSADFLVRLGIDSVSCSPFRIPLARLGIAQALLSSGRVDIDDIHFDYGTASGEGPVPAGADSGESADTTLDPEAVDEALDEPLDVDEALVLHVLRLRGFLTADGFVDSLGTHPAELLASLVDAGAVRHLEARGLYALLPPGREMHEQLLAAPAGFDPARLADPYATFLELNAAVKALCTHWQLRNGEPNDHSDAEYDRRCIDELRELVDRTDGVMRSLAEVVPRLDRYRLRLHRAVRCVAAGETKRFTGVACESFHDVWMELHEDLIVLQGIDRNHEGSF